MTPPDKTCATCGRAMAWRRKWASTWEAVRYCGDACRQNRQGPADEALEEAILTLLASRARGATICPSEAARAIRPEDWRQWMERARMAARRLVDKGRIDLMQGGRVVDPSRARGPIRLRLR